MLTTSSISYMGANKTRKERFFTKHPICCFCGGSRPATTQDHFPSRGIFNGRVWPSGYVFPACELCQRHSVSDEILVKMVARATAKVVTARDEKDIADMFNAVFQLHPDVFESMKMSANQKRAAFKRNSLPQPAGTPISHQPMIAIGHPKIQAAISNFATKLFCALYYKHIGKVLSESSSILFHWHTNAQPFAAKTYEEDLIPYLPSFAELRAQATDLGDQFSYRYIVPSDAEFAGFVCNFHSSMTLLGFIYPDRPVIEIYPGAQALAPLRHLSPYV